MYPIAAAALRSSKLTSLAVDPQGNPWVVTDNGGIFRHDGSSWYLEVGDGGKDIGIGGNSGVAPNGAVHVVTAYGEEA